MENQEQIKSIVLDYIRKEYIDDEDEEINFDTPLISGGYVDSFSMITLLVFLENNFRIKIPSSKATPEAFNTVNNIAFLVSQYIKN
jgi:acyl carrier protein/D-alanine--poly(phosphoribitol) ligase subunit 2